METGLFQRSSLQEYLRGLQPVSKQGFLRTLKNSFKSFTSFLPFYPICCKSGQICPYFILEQQSHTNFTLHSLVLPLIFVISPSYMFLSLGKLLYKNPQEQNSCLKREEQKPMKLNRKEASDKSMCLALLRLGGLPAKETESLNSLSVKDAKAQMNKTLFKLISKESRKKITSSEFSSVCLL